MAEIVKTRQSAPSDCVEVFDPEVGRARGVLMPAPLDGQMRHARRRPPEDLAAWIQHFWIVSWDLRGCPPFRQQTLPHPNVHVIFEVGRSGIAGGDQRDCSPGCWRESPASSASSSGPVVFVPFLAGRLRCSNDRVVPIGTAFGSEAAGWESAMLSLEDDDAQMDTAASFLRKQLPGDDENVALAARLVEQISCLEGDTGDPRRRRTRTQQQAPSQRSLQTALSGNTLAPSPKWVIRRYRLHDLVERLKAGEALDGAQAGARTRLLAIRRTSFNDFRSIVGYSPARYRRLLRRAPDSWRYDFPHDQGPSPLFLSAAGSPAHPSRHRRKTQDRRT